MRKMLGIGLVAVLALVGANTVQATSIGINILGSGDWYAPGWVTGTQVGWISQNNWNNLDCGAGGDLTFTAQNKSVELPPGTPNWTAPFVYDNGTDVSGLTVSVTGAGSVPDGYGASHTLGNSFIQGFGTVVISAIPYGAYDVAVMTGYYDTNISWYRFTGDASITCPDGNVLVGAFSGSTFTLTTDGSTSVAAIQIMESGSPVPEPGTWLLLGGSLLGLCVGGFRRFVRK